MVAEHEAFIGAERPGVQTVRRRSVVDVPPERGRFQHGLALGCLDRDAQRRRCGAVGLALGPVRCQLPVLGCILWKAVASHLGLLMRMPGRGHESSVKPSRDDRMPAGRREPPGHHSRTHPRPHANESSRRKLAHPHGRGEPNVPHGKQNLAAGRTGRLVIEHLTGRCTPGFTAGSFSHVARGHRDPRAHLREHPRPLEHGFIVDHEVAVTNRQPLARQTDDPLDRHAIRR